MSDTNPPAMSRIRIFVRHMPGCESFPTTFVDCTVFAIGEDGKQTRLTNVQAVSLKVEKGGSAVKACIRFVNVEVDAIVDAEVER